jgi:hypothetical protein
MVFVARGAMARAEQHATLGADTQRQHRDEHAPLPPAGLHWIRGLIVAAGGRTDEALASFADEIATSSSGHIYARECAANARVATGAIQLARGDRAGAEATFRHTLVEMPGHPRATLGLFAAVDPHDDSSQSHSRREATNRVIEALQKGGRPIEAALVTAGKHLVVGEAAAAMAILHRLLHDAPPGPAGWIIPVDPMLIGLRQAEGYTNLLAKLAARAV